MTLELTVQDTAPTLTGTLTNGTTAVDLTGASIALHIRRPDATVINRAGTIVSPTAGTWSLAIISGDLTISGLYRVEVQVTFASGAIQTFADDTNGQGVRFMVRDQIA